MSKLMHDEKRRRLVRQVVVLSLKTEMMYHSPSADMGSAVKSICMAIFLGTALPKATAGVEQNRPTDILMEKWEGR